MTTPAATWPDLDTLAGRPCRRLRAPALTAGVVALAILGLAVGCSDDDDGDLAGLCAVAGRRDLGAIVVQKLDDGPVAVSTPQATLDAGTAESLSRSFANIVEESSTPEIRADAEVYVAALRAGLDRRELQPAEREAAIAAGERIEAYLVETCPDQV